MEVLRKKGVIQIEVHSQADAVALYALLSGRQDWVTPEEYARVGAFWAHFFAHVQELGVNYQQAMGVKKEG